MKQRRPKPKKQAMQKISFLFLLFLLSAPFATLIAATDFDNVENFGSHRGDYGPFDYTNPEDFLYRLPIVEEYHFTPGGGRA
jgi:hypothetical protein